MTERFVAQAPEDLRRFVAIEAIETTKGNHAAAISSAETALAQEPDDPACRAGLAVSLLLAGRSEEALGQISRAIEAVHDPAGWFLGTRVWCKFFLGRTDEALSEADALVAAKPDYHPAAVLAAAAAAELGQRDKATGHARRAQRTDPSFSVDRFVRFSGLRDPAHRERIAMALRSAGLPD
jgi:tetratricopeptide (TPR) repeat protein